MCPTRASSPAVFLDRDGTINEDFGYVHSPDDFVFIGGAVEALRSFQALGYLLVIATNQSGIARGLYSEDDYWSLSSWMLGELEREGVHIDALYYCPHLPDASDPKYRKVCRCRKPGLGMFERAIDDLCIDAARSIVIGDRMRDLSLCGKVGCRGFLIGCTEGEDIIRSVRQGFYPGISWAESLLACACELIEGKV